MAITVKTVTLLLFIQASTGQSSKHLYYYEDRPRDFQINDRFNIHPPKARQPVAPLVKPTVEVTKHLPVVNKAEYYDQVVNTPPDRTIYLGDPPLEEARPKPSKALTDVKYDQVHSTKVGKQLHHTPKLIERKPLQSTLNKQRPQRKLAVARLKLKSRSHVRPIKSPIRLTKPFNKSFSQPLYFYSPKTNRRYKHIHIKKPLLKNAVNSGNIARPLVQTKNTRHADDFL